MQNYRYRLGSRGEEIPRARAGAYRTATAGPHAPGFRDALGAELCAGIALDQMPVTMAYVPWTKWRNIYEAEKGLRRGTIFQDLDKPFRGIGGCQNGR